MARRELVTPWATPKESFNDESEHRSTLPEGRSVHRPFNPLQALMEAAPNEVSQTSQMEMLVLRDLLADALDQLDPWSRSLIEARIIEKRTFRALERKFKLTKSSLHRHEQLILKQLAESLEDHPAIQAYLTRHDDTENI